MMSTESGGPVARRKRDSNDGGDGLESIPPPALAPRSAFSSLPKDWAQAGEVLDRVTAVPTIFPDFNRATTVGGLPVRRIHTVHGPTHGGKTAFILGLLRSFVDLGHAAAYIDAEHATPKEFANECFGQDIDGIPNLFASRPKTYEETITKVDSFLAWVARERAGDPDAKEKAKRIPARPNLCSIIVVDSINKLTPARELANILAADGEIKAGKGGKGNGADELAKGHHARYRAALNQAWLDHLVPLLAKANCALVLIAQERDDDVDAFEMKDIVKVKGGAALLFDASLLVRVMKAYPVRVSASDKESPICGFAHRARLWKNKVGHMTGRYSDCVFNLSNGALIAPGFDMARDAVTVGQSIGIVKESGGAWLTWKRNRWQGVNKAVVGLSAKPELLAELMAEVNAAMKKEAA